MSRGTTLFSCGSVGEFMPFVFCVVFGFFLLFHPFFCHFKEKRCGSSDARRFRNGTVRLEGWYAFFFCKAFTEQIAPLIV